MIPKGKKGLTRLGKFKQGRVKNKFYSKSQCYKANFSGVHFYNVNFKGSVLTSCSFKNTKLSNVDFIGTNLKKSNFTGATFKNCIFAHALLKKANFKNCSFYNCIFVATNTENVKNFPSNHHSTILKSYPEIDIPSDILDALGEYRFNSNIHNSRVLYLKGGKLNSLTIWLTINRFGEHSLRAALRNLKGILPKRIITSHDFSQIIDLASKTT